MNEDDKAAVVVAEDVRKHFGPTIQRARNARRGKAHPALPDEGGREGPPLEEVLRGASLHVAAGELVALVGQSGSGKSTLLSILGGLDRDFTGRVTLFQQDLGGLSDRALSRLRGSHVGFVFQAFHLLDHLSCVDNVLLPNAFSDAPLPVAAAQERAREALSRVGLDGKANARPTELSGGQKQRVAIARALFFRPKLLLCDEPTGNLDVDTGRRIIELFTTLHRDEGLTLILVTHEPRVAAVAQRILRMEGGLAVSATLEELSHPLTNSTNVSTVSTGESPEAAP